MLYDLICASAPAVEHNEIRRVLGVSVVEENKDLLNEVEALTEIHSTFQAETCELRQTKTKSHAFLMPDRERLLGNIKFFVDNIQRAATPMVGGRPRSTPQTLMSSATVREQKVIDYVTAELGRSVDREAPETPRMAGALRPSSRAGRPSTAPANPEPLIAKATVLELGEVKSELRRMLHEENTALKEKVETLRLQLEDSIEDRDRLESEEPPSISEMKGLESKLEKMSMQAACPVIGHPSLYLGESEPMIPEPAPAEPPRAKRSNSSSPKKAQTSQPKPPKLQAGPKKPLSVHNSSLVLDCSAP